METSKGNHVIPPSPKRGPGPINFIPYTPTTKFAPHKSNNPDHVSFLVPIEPPIILEYSSSYYDYDYSSSSEESSDEESSKTDIPSINSTFDTSTMDPIDLLRIVLETKWNNNEKRNVGPVIMPPEAYPIICCIVSSGILSENPTQPLFDQYCDILFKSLSDFPIQKSIPLLLLFEVLGKHLKCELFAKKSYDFRKDCLLRLFHPYLKNANVLIRRIATAQFEHDSALIDLKNEIFSINFDKHTKQNSFPLQDEINSAILSAFQTEFDAKLWVHIVKSPDRLCFENSTKWNSLITAVESVYQLNFPLTREGIFTLCMLQKISLDPSLAKDIAPHLPPQLLCYLMMNYRPDEKMPIPIDFFKFMQKNNIKNVDDWKIEPLPIPDFDLIKQKMVISDLFQKPFQINDKRFSFMEHFKWTY